MAYWQTEANTCEWGQHYIGQPIARLSDSGRQTEFCHLCREGATLTDLSANKSSIWRMKRRSVSERKHSWLQIKFLKAKFSFSTQRQTLCPSATPCPAKPGIISGETMPSSPLVCDGKPLNPQRKAVTQWKQSSGATLTGLSSSGSWGPNRATELLNVNTGK